MDGKDVEGVVDARQELELGGKVAAGAAAEADDDGAPGGDEAGGGGDGDEARDGAGAEADGAPFPLEAVVEQDPGEAAARGGQVGHVAGHDGAEVHGQRGAAVEAEPADPEEDGAEDDVGHAVRAVWEALRLGVARSLAEHDAVRERAGARGDVHRAAACEVVRGQLVQPAVCVPRPVGDGVVYYRRPDEDEDDGGEDAAAVGNGADGESWPVYLGRNLGQEALLRF